MSVQVPQNTSLVSASRCAKSNWEGEGGSNGAAASSRFPSISLLLNLPSDNSCFPKSRCKECAVLKKIKANLSVRGRKSHPDARHVEDLCAWEQQCLGLPRPGAALQPGLPRGRGVWGSPKGVFQAAGLVPGNLVPSPHVAPRTIFPLFAQLGWFCAGRGWPALPSGNSVAAPPAPAAPCPPATGRGAAAAAVPSPSSAGFGLSQHCRDAPLRKHHPFRHV